MPCRSDRAVVICGHPLGSVVRFALHFMRFIICFCDFYGFWATQVVEVCVVLCLPDLYVAVSGVCNRARTMLVVLGDA